MTTHDQVRLPSLLCVILTITAGLLAWQCLRHQARSIASVTGPAATLRPPVSPKPGKLPPQNLTPPGFSPSTQPKSGFGSQEEHAYSVDHPEYLQLCAADYADDIAVEYAPMFRLLGLSADDRAAVLQTMVSKRLASILHAGQDPQEIGAAWTESDAKLKQLLPPEAYATYKWYTMLPTAGRYSLMEIGEQTAYSGQPLSVEQERTLWGTVKNAFTSSTSQSIASPAAQAVWNFYKTGILDDTLLQPMSAKLTADQMRIAFGVMHGYADQKKNFRHNPPSLRVKYN